MTPEPNTQTREEKNQIQDMVERYKQLFEEMTRYIMLYNNNQTQYAYVNNPLWFPDEECIVQPEANVVVKLYSDVIVVSFPYSVYKTYVYRVSTVRYIYEILESPYYDIILKAVKMCAEKEEKKRDVYIEIVRLLNQLKK